MTSKNISRTHIAVFFADGVPSKGFIKASLAIVAQAPLVANDKLVDGRKSENAT